MTILAVMRHAKSDWGQPGLDDFDRSLNERGRKAAKRVGRELMDRHVHFDRVIASPAARVRETLAGLEKGYGQPLAVEFEERLYNANLGTLAELVRSIPDHVHAPLLVGHNPGLHRLVLDLTAKDDPLGGRLEDNFPTAALALIELPGVRWDEVGSGAGRIAELILPRELD